MLPQGKVWEKEFAYVCAYWETVLRRENINRNMWFYIAKNKMNIPSISLLYGSLWLTKLLYLHPIHLRYIGQVRKYNNYIKL